MKRVVGVACTLLLIPVAAFALTASEAHLSSEAIAAILGQPGTASSCAWPPSGVRLAAKKPDGGGDGVGALAFCSADCVPPNSVSCSGATCSAADRNCTVFERGHVTCDSTTYWCPDACTTDYCYDCAQTGSCYSCCRCDGGTAVNCSWCCQCDATNDCYACCRCAGGGPGCAQQCS